MLFLFRGRRAPRPFYRSLVTPLIVAAGMAVHTPVAVAEQVHDDTPYQ